jgi:hypothetical protein
MTRPGTARTARRATRSLVTLLGALVLGGIVVGGLALAAPAPASPTISSGPSNPTTSTSATFTFTGESGATFQCKVDAAAYGACSSPRTYTGLSFASHTFRIRAVKGGKTSGDAVFTWVVSNDTTPPPVPTITAGPPSLTSSTSASFSFTDAEAGVSFLCRVDAAAFAACTSPKSYSGISNSAHTFQVKAHDAAGNESAPASRSWTVDTVPPPAPVLVDYPEDGTSDTTATFTFTGEAGATFRCSIEHGPYQPCSSPHTYTPVDLGDNGQHWFEVRAVDAAGNVSSTTSHNWKIAKGISFAITGNGAGLLYPGGAWVELPLVITNSKNFTLQITGITVSVSASPGGCAAGTNVEIQQSNLSPSNRFAVPGNNSATLPSANRPRIRMVDTGVNQDACQGTSFGLSYSGTATK